MMLLKDLGTQCDELDFDSAVPIIIIEVSERYFT